MVMVRRHGLVLHKQLKQGNACPFDRFTLVVTVELSVSPHFLEFPPQKYLFRDYLALNKSSYDLAWKRASSSHSDLYEIAYVRYNYIGG